MNTVILYTRTAVTVVLSLCTTRVMRKALRLTDFFRGEELPTWRAKMHNYDFQKALLAVEWAFLLSGYGIAESRVFKTRLGKN